MAGNENWRFRKVQELGLVDTRPVVVKGDRAQPATPPSSSPEPVLKPPTTAPPETVAPLQRSAPTRRPAGKALQFAVPSTIIFAAFAIGLVLAAAAGWLLRGAIGRPDPVMAVESAARPSVAQTIPQGRPSPPVATVALARPSAESLVAEAAVIMPPAVVKRAKAGAAHKPSARSPAAGKAAAKPAVQGDPGIQAARSSQARPLAQVSAHRNATPSFNCRHARTDVNRMICADSSLRALDKAMSNAYRAAVRRGGVETQYRLDREQASFLNMRAGCETPDCVARISRRRLDDLIDY